MSTVNKTILIGYLGRDAEVRYLPDGTATASISLATSENWKDKTTGERVERTDWHRVVFYDRLAEVAGEYLTQGKLIYVEGRLRTRKYTDKDGVERQVTEVRGDEMRMLGGKGKDNEDDTDKAGPAGSVNGAANLRTAPQPAPDDDDIPF